MNTRTRANTVTTAAAMASPLSTMLRPAAAGMGRGAGTGREAGAGAAAAGRVPAAGEAAGALVTGAAATGAAGAGVAAATAAGDGILIVGAAVGFGGRLIRTVSFLGWTLPDSEGFGGGAPEGTLGVFSAITYCRMWAQPRIRARRCQIDSCRCRAAAPA